MIVYILSGKMCKYCQFLCFLVANTVTVSSVEALSRNDPEVDSMCAIITFIGVIIIANKMNQKQLLVAIGSL